MRVYLDKIFFLNIFDLLVWVFILLMYEIFFCDIVVFDLYLLMFYGRVCDFFVIVFYDVGICVINLMF